MTSPDMPQVVRRAQQGDTDAIANLYERYANVIYRYVSYRVSTTADAEDLTAEVFLKMVEGLPGYREQGTPFEAWLYRIASARIIDFRRRAQRRPLTILTDGLEDSKPLPEEQLQQRQEVDTLRRAISVLSDEQQAILVLRFIERKSHQQVADLIGKSVSAVKSIQHRALIQLAAQLGSEEKVRHYLRGSHD
jgi:RNA polymerase sigma-70 factor (ECF subfamily)